MKYPYIMILFVELSWCLGQRGSSLGDPRFQLILGLAFVAARTFLHYHLPLAIMSFSFCAIAITFWHAGIGPGVLALVLAVLIRTFFFQPDPRGPAVAWFGVKNITSGDSCPI
jgi:hypothetical protein